MKYYFKYFLFVFAIGLLCSCNSTKVAQEDVVVENIVDQKLAKSLLWKITGNDITTPSYLYGTIHIIDEKDFFYPNGTLAAIEKTENMVFEIDMEEMSDMSGAMSMLQKAFMDDGLTLKDLVSEEDYKLIDTHFKKMGIPLFMMQRIKPMFLTVFGSGDFSPEDLQSGKIKSYEMEFAKIAKEKSLPTGGLETIDFQISIFDQIPYKDQAVMLVESIKSADTGSSDFKQMIDIYTSQDIEGMQTLMQGDETIEEYEDILLVGRNKNWIPLMKNIMTEKPTFFAVGAGHLAGDEGVIKLLIKEGYQLIPVIGL